MTLSFIKSEKGQKLNGALEHSGSHLVPFILPPTYDLINHADYP